jgi:D-alanine-D-alanine ligase
MAIPKDEAECRQALPELFELDTLVMAEEFIAGPEVTCGVLDVEVAGPRALPVTEIRPVSSEFFDYHAKYTPGACREITPAEISEEAARRVQAVAVRVHEVIGCRGFSRSDMILVDDEPVWLEVNTIPGMTETSLLPQAAALVGVSLGDLVGMLVESAVGRRAANVVSR